jgi:hypothetical protein
MSSIWFRKNPCWPATNINWTETRRTTTRQPRNSFLLGLAFSCGMTASVSQDRASIDSNYRLSAQWLKAIRYESSDMNLETLKSGSSA